MSSEPTDASRLLDAIGRGDPGAANELLPIVYDELRRLASARLARERGPQTLDATGLVHEAYLRLVGPGPDRPWDGRRHFFAAAAEAMRRILIDRARDRKRLKRGGPARRLVELDLDAVASDDAPPDLLLDLDQALERLSGLDARGAELVRLRLFAGLSLGEAAEAIGVSRSTADRDWAFARAWLFARLGPRDPEDGRDDPVGS
jgi:RNA polymerase sigma factor (TIGR02999 family)